MNAHLDWSAYEANQDFGFGDFFGDPGSTAVIPGSGYANALGTCSGKQQCLRLDQEVMCPSFRVTGDERHSPYHRANVLRQALMDDDVEGTGFHRAEVSEALDLCVGCKGCKRECPNGMDIAMAATEARARARAQGGADTRRDRLFSALPEYIGRLRAVRPLLRLADTLPGINRLIRRSAGLAPKRRLPTPARRSFIDDNPSTSYGDGRRGDVVLMVDTFSNHFDPDIADAALGLLVRLGYRVHLPSPGEASGPLCCGRTYLSRGMVDEAKAMAGRLIDTYFPFAEAGMPIIGLEPSCLLMLRDEYRSLGLGTKVPVVANQSVLIEEFLTRLIDEDGGALALKPMHDRQILVHGHCHQKAFGTVTAVERLLTAIPGVFLTPIESGCCGMAGAFGYEIEHYDISMRMAEDRLLPAVRNAPTGAVIVANGTSCRQQIQHGAGRTPVHLVELLYQQMI